jgi:hypothetical protein
MKAAYPYMPIHAPIRPPTTILGALKNRENRGGGSQSSSSSYLWRYCLALTRGEGSPLAREMLVLKGLRKWWSTGLLTRGLSCRVLV